jgi:hypothetical protein
MHVGATLAVARDTGEEILRCAQNDRDGGPRGVEDAAPYGFYGGAGGGPEVRRVVVPYGFYVSAGGPAAMHVGATLAVARDTGARFFAALRMTGRELRPAGGRAEQSPAPTGLTGCGDGPAARRVVAPYGVDRSAEKI